MIGRKPWTLSEGFLIGLGLIIVGLVLQLSIGPIDWSLFAWPVNIIALAALLLVVVGIFALRRRIYVCQFLGTYTAAVPALCYGVVLTVVMGLTRQTPATSSFGENLWLSDMLMFWPFVLIYTYIALILGLVILKRIVPSRPLSYPPRGMKKASPRGGLVGALFHLGLFIALTTATLGNADKQRLQLYVTNNPQLANLFTGAELFHQYESTAIDDTGRRHELPLAIELKQFIMEMYDDSITPRRFASEVIIYSEADRHKYAATIEVNKPVEVDGWKIYQKDYRVTEAGDDCQLSILELVSDPWLPWVYAGIYLMLAGAVCFMLLSIPWANGWRQARKHPGRALSIVVLIAASFFCVHHFMPILHSDTLVPALQSPWFKPHIIAYMLAYTLMASAALMALFLLFKKKPLTSHPSPLTSIVCVGLALITVGMLFGALWAKEAWGHYWSWDPKETWAAATWLGYLVYIHYRRYPRYNPRVALWMLVVCFLLLQMCWWGINYLPSAQGASVHTY